MSQQETLTVIQEMIIKYFRESNKLFGHTYVIVTHDKEWEKIADTVLHINGGEIYEKNN